MFEGFEHGGVLGSWVRYGDVGRCPKLALSMLPQEASARDDASVMILSSAISTTTTSGPQNVDSGSVTSLRALGGPAVKKICCASVVASMPNP